MTINEIAICSTGKHWDVVALRDGFADSHEPIWCETKSEAVCEGRKLFNATPSAKRLIVEGVRDRVFTEIRSR